MKKTYWILASLILTLILVLITFLLMLWSDTYSNTHYERTHFYSEPNKNVLKVNYILNHKNTYDSFIFGSSRVGNINPLKLSNGKYYNMTYSEGLPKEHFLNIQLFIQEGVKIKNLLIGLDEFSYQVSFLKHQHQGLTKAYFQATDTNIFTYYRELYFRFPLSEDRHHIKKKLFHSPNYFTMDISKQERNYKHAEKEFNVSQYNTKSHLNDPRFSKPTFYNGNFLNESLENIQKIQNTCATNNINCKFFINPIHHKTYAYTNKKLLFKFKEELAKITDFYDFSEPNEISKDNRYWLDTSHYRLDIGDLIIKTIYNDKVYVKNFGIHIKKEEKN
jgi:hypothetical protein